ncbi:MAG: sensor histidine kinase [Steroidobacter sp.]
MNPEPEVILNVNDTEPNRYVTTRILSRAGFRVLEAATGAEALRLARKEQPPLVVLDVNLPDISGIEVCRRLKEQPDTASIMVLQMSATNIAVLDRVHSLGAGADSFLVEPVEPEELEAVARALLRLHRSEASLRRSLAERELLLKEVNHRVKNSLQLVMSMLSLQGSELEDADAREHFTKAIARIAAIAAVHERLYQTDDPLSVEMRGYLTGLCDELARAGISDRNECTLRSDIEAVRLPTNQGVSLALIVNELVINALKYGGRVDQHVVINVCLRRLTDSELQLTVADNGAGAALTNKAESGLGTRLIKMLAQQLKGRVETANLDEGYTVVVTFPSA